jgi:hypothetical protein
LAKPLFEATKWGWGREPLEWWGEEQEKAFKEIKRALTNAPDLGLPDMMKPFSCKFMRKMKRLLGS